MISGIVLYLMIWWVVFIAALPWGTRPETNARKGQDSGAPAKPNLWLKVGVTTLIAGVLWLGARWLITSGVIHLDVERY